MLKMVCFDMDGTIADLYGFQGWLDKLRAHDPSPYRWADPMWDMEKLANVLSALQKKGIEIKVITWLSKDSTSTYDRLVRTAKQEWLKSFNFPYDAFHCVKYGATKADSIRKYLRGDDTAILIDDNAKVRRGWHMGEAVDPATTDIIKYLAQFL